LLEKFVRDSFNSISRREKKCCCCFFIGIF